MNRRSSARLAKLQSDLVLIDKARMGLLAAELADAVKCHVLAVEALSAPSSTIPPVLADLSHRAMEHRSASALQMVLRAEQKLLDDGCQLKLLEARAAREAALETTAAEREQLADVLERLVDTRTRV